MDSQVSHHLQRTFCVRRSLVRDLEEARELVATIADRPVRLVHADESADAWVFREAKGEACALASHRPTFEADGRITVVYCR
jgi:hypothetical protein